MANQRDATQEFIIDVQQQLQCSTGALDFTTGYIHAGSYIINPLSCALECDSMPRSSTSYYQTLTQIGLEDFILSFKVNASYLEQHGTSGFGGGHFSLMFANLQTTTNQQASADANGGAGDGIVFSYRAYNVNNQHLMQIRSRYNGTENYAEVNLPTGVTYNVTITRTNLEVIMTVRDEAGNILFINDGIGENPIPRPDNTYINYFVPMCGRGDTIVPDQVASAVLWDYTLSYATQGENFLNYELFTETGDVVSRTSSAISFTGLSLNSNAYCRRNVNFTDFNLWLTLNLTALTAACPDYYGGHILIATFTRQPESTSWDVFNYSYGNKDGITLRVGCWTNTAGENQHFLRFHNNQDDSSPDTWVFQWSGATTPRSFVINIVQSGTTVTTTIYDPSDLITPLHTFTHTGVSNATPYQYFFPFCSMAITTCTPPDCVTPCSPPYAPSTGSMQDYEFI